MISQSYVSRSEQLDSDEEIDNKDKVDGGYRLNYIISLVIYVSSLLPKFQWQSITS